MSQRCHAQRAAGQYEVWRQRDQFRRVSSIAIDIVLAPAGVDPDVAAVAPSQLLQGLLERRQLDLVAWIVRGPVHEHNLRPNEPTRRMQSCGNASSARKWAARSAR